MPENPFLDEATIMGLVASGFVAFFLLRAVPSRAVKFLLGAVLLTLGLFMIRPDWAGLELTPPEGVLRSAVYGGLLAGGMLVLGSFTQRTPRAS